LSDIETISVVIAAASVVVGVVNHIVTSRQANTIQQTQLFMDLYAQMRNKEFIRDTRELTSWKWDSFEDFRKKYGSRADKDANSLFVSTSYFFDGVGLLVKRGLLKPQLVSDLMSDWIVWYWEKFGPVVKEYQKVSYPQYLQWTEYLHSSIRKTISKQHPDFGS